jgi:hypothetical protein
MGRFSGHLSFAIRLLGLMTVDVTEAPKQDAVADSGGVTAAG